MWCYGYMRGVTHYLMLGGGGGAQYVIMMNMAWLFVVV